MPTNGCTSPCDPSAKSRTFTNRRLSRQGRGWCKRMRREEPPDELCRIDRVAGWTGDDARKRSRMSRPLVAQIDDGVEDDLAVGVVLPVADRSDAVVVTDHLHRRALDADELEPVID